MMLDVTACRQIRHFLEDRQDDLSRSKGWRFVNRMLTRRAARGARLCRMYMRLSTRRAIPDQYGYFLEIGEVCSQCARDGREQCPARPDVMQED